MKGIILAGGVGSRLYPLTKVTNKALLPVGKVPLIYHLIDLYKRSNITEIMIVTNTEHVGHVISTLGSGSEFGVDLTYKVQDKPDGIAGALRLCKNFINNEKFAVLLGDNIFTDTDEIAKEISSFAGKYKLFLKQVVHPERFGVPIFDKHDNIIDIIEKPKNPKTNLAVVGLYLYDQDVFNIMTNLKPSGRGEYEISDVNSYLVKNEVGSYYKFKCDWFDAGNFDSYIAANLAMNGEK